MTAPPSDPRVRGFLDALAEAVAESVLAELRADEILRREAERERRAG